MDIVLLCILAYLLGSIPSGVWIGKIFYNKDIRELGSGNTGATNTFRNLGPKAGTAALIMDVLKGSIATLIPICLGTEIHPIFIGFFAILGHIFSIFLKFQGGKAAATTAGVGLAIQPLFVFIFILVFILILFISSTVSVASIVTFPIAAIFSLLLLDDPVFSTFIFILAAIIIYLHRSNIRRLIDGTESRVPFGLRSSKKNK